MKRFYLFLLLLITMTTANAANRNGHFFMSLKGQNVTKENVEQRFSQWFSLPDQTEWSLVSQRTNRQGITRMEFRQYVGGVEVEHSQVLLHVKDGIVVSANGTVMEARRTPAALHLFRRNAPVEGTPADKLGRKIYLIDTRDGYRYATKELSTDQRCWIYTDLETGEQIKRIPVRHPLTEEPVKVTGKSLYSGDVEMDACLNTESGKYTLYDPVRNIHTLVGSPLPSIEQMVEDGTFSLNLPEVILPVPEEQMTMEQWEEWAKGFDPHEVNLTTYVKNNAEYATSPTTEFAAYKFTDITFDKVFTVDDDFNYIEIVPTEDDPLPISIELHYGKDGNGLIHRTIAVARKMPISINFDAISFLYELPTEGVTIQLWKEDDITRYLIGEDDDDDEESERELLASLHVVPDASLAKEFDQEDVKASVKYEPSSWIANDIHWGMERTYDFYVENFERKSYDGAGSPIFNLFYLPDQFAEDTYFIQSNPANAFALSIPPYPMVYGPSDGNTEYEMTELSVIAHEFTHLITDATAALVYEGESGALNESFSDLMGISVKKYVKGNDASWKIGEGTSQKNDNIRDIAFPKKSGDGESDACPDTYEGEHWADPNDELDYGGVHTNCGVQNKWYYLLSDGDTGTNDKGFTYDVTGIGIEKAQQIAYLTLTEFATKEAQYADIRLCSHQAAQLLYGEESAEAKTVLDAWDAVGVSENNPPTSIETVAPATTTSHNYYDLQGRRILQPETGIYVKDGRKVFVR